MKHEFDSQTKFKFHNCFIWDRNRINKIDQALIDDNIFTLRVLMSESEDELLSQLSQRLTCDETEIHNARVETLERMKECYTQVEDKIIEYLEKDNAKLNTDIHI